MSAVYRHHGVHRLQGMPSGMSYQPFVLILAATLGGGILLPLVLRLVPRYPGSRRAMIAALLVLVGGFVLRYSILRLPRRFCTVLRR